MVVLRKLILQPRENNKNSQKKRGKYINEEKKNKYTQSGLIPLFRQRIRDGTSSNGDFDCSTKPVCRRPRMPLVDSCIHENFYRSCSDLTP